MKLPDGLTGERAFPEVGAEECSKTCPLDCEEHKWHCVYWLRLAPEVAYSENYYDYASTVNNADVYTDGYVGVSRRLEGRYSQHKNEATKKGYAPLKELIEWYGDSIQLLILAEQLSKTEAYELETFYRPYLNLGWNKAEGGLRNEGDYLNSDKANSKRLQTFKRKGKLVYICNIKLNKNKKIEEDKVDVYLKANPDWRRGALRTSSHKIYYKHLCFERCDKRYMTANILKKHLLDNKAEHCENPLACCLDFKPIDVLVDDILTELEQNRLHTAIELHALQKQRGYILGKANKKLDTEIG